MIRPLHDFRHRRACATARRSAPDRRCSRNARTADRRIARSSRRNLQVVAARDGAVGDVARQLGSPAKCADRCGTCCAEIDRARSTQRECAVGGRFPWRRACRSTAASKAFAEKAPRDLGVERLRPSLNQLIRAGVASRTCRMSDGVITFCCHAYRRAAPARRQLARAVFRLAVPQCAAQDLADIGLGQLAAEFDMLWAPCNSVSCA